MSFLPSASNDEPNEPQAGQDRRSHYRFFAEVHGRSEKSKKKVGEGVVLLSACSKEREEKINFAAKKGEGSSGWGYNFHIRTGDRTGEERTAPDKRGDSLCVKKKREEIKARGPDRGGRQSHLRRQRSNVRAQASAKSPRCSDENARRMSNEIAR